MSERYDIDDDHGLLEKIQKAVSEYLEEHLPLDGVIVLNELKGDLDNYIERKISEIGLVCVVMTPEARVEHPNIPGPYFDQILVTVSVLERAIINQGENGAHKTCSQVAEMVAHCLHAQRLHGLHESIYCAPDALQPVPVPGNSPVDVAYNVNFITRGGFKPQNNP